MISDNVVVMTKEEFDRKLNETYQRGIRNGAFFERLKKTYVKMKELDELIKEVDAKTKFDG